MSDSAGANRRPYPSASGLTPIELEALRAVRTVGGTESPRRSETVLEVLESQLGLGPAYAYPLLLDLMASWKRHLPLLVGLGNVGTRQGDEAAAAQYTEVSLSEIGSLALAADVERLGPLPLDLIEGSFCRGGQVPPFHPRLVVQALLGDNHDVGEPSAPTGTITGQSSTTDPTRLTGSASAAERQFVVVDEVPVAEDGCRDETCRGADVAVRMRLTSEMCSGQSGEPFRPR